MNVSAVNKHIKALVNLAQPSERKGLFKCIEQAVSAGLKSKALHEG